MWLRLANGAVGRYWSNKIEPVYGQFNFVVAGKKRPAVAGDGREAVSRSSRRLVRRRMILQQELQVPVTDLRFLLAQQNGRHWRFAGGRVEKWKNNRRERDLGPYPWGDTPCDGRL